MRYDIAVRRARDTLRRLADIVRNVQERPVTALEIERAADDGYLDPYCCFVLNLHAPPLAVIWDDLEQPRLGWSVFARQFRPYGALLRFDNVAWRWRCDIDGGENFRRLEEAQRRLARIADTHESDRVASDIREGLLHLDFREAWWITRLPALHVVHSSDSWFLAPTPTELSSYYFTWTYPPVTTEPTP